MNYYAIGAIIFVTFVVVCLILTNMTGAQYQARQRMKAKKKNKEMSSAKLAAMVYFDLDKNKSYEITNRDQINCTSRRQPPLPMQIVPTSIDEEGHVFGKLRVLYPRTYQIEDVKFLEDIADQRSSRQSFSIMFRFRNTNGKWYLQDWSGEERPMVDKFPIYVIDKEFIPMHAADMPPVPVV